MKTSLPTFPINLPYKRGERGLPHITFRAYDSLIIYGRFLSRSMPFFSHLEDRNFPFCPRFVCHSLSLYALFSLCSVLDQHVDPC
jgi:hypothetical protein